MRIYKKTYTDKEGKLKHYQKWYVEIPDHRGKARRFTGYKDKRLTEKMGQRIELLILLKKTTEPLTEDLTKWLEAADRKLKEQLLKIGLLEARQAQAGKPLTQLLSEYLENRKHRGCCIEYRNDINRKLNSFFEKTKCTFWTDIDSQKIERFMAEVKALGKSFKTINDYLTYFKGFHNWLLDMELIARPLPGLRKIKKLDTRLDRRKVRRALTTDELERLLRAARQRPLYAAQTINRGPDKGKQGAQVTAETKDKLLLLGLERALIYKAAFLTGLRRSELASIATKGVRLQSVPQRLILQAQDEKNHNGSELPLRKDIAAEIGDFIEQKGLAPDSKLFIVPNLKTFKKDLAFAGIEFKDESGRTVDFHALRTCLATHLSMAKVGPRTAQAALRHSDIKLTMQVYTDPQLLDVSGALESLPALSINPSPKKNKKLG